MSKIEAKWKCRKCGEVWYVSPLWPRSVLDDAILQDALLRGERLIHKKCGGEWHREDLDNGD